MDKALRTVLYTAVVHSRQLLEDDFRQQLEGHFGIHADGQMEPLSLLPHLDAAGQADRRSIEAALTHETTNQASLTVALDRFVRESAFTFLNRIAAIKLFEHKDRKILMQSVGQGDQSTAFKQFLLISPEALRDKADNGYQKFLELLFDDLSYLIDAIFDQTLPTSILFPTQSGLLHLLDLLNSPTLEPVWGEDETIGWIYQYFTPGELRQTARAESSVPRNSYELSFRNQFYTPRYVVAFLAENTLGRAWYQMRRGHTALTERCKYMVRYPDEVFLSEDALIGDPYSDEPDPYSLFLSGKTDELPLFGPLHHTVHPSVPVPGEENTYTWPHVEYGLSSTRLIEFAYKVRPFDWSSDRRRDGIWRELLATEPECPPEVLLAASTQDLWDCLLAIARLEHFSDGAIAEHAEALTRIANEIRRRLLIGRDPKASSAERQRAPHLVQFQKSQKLKDPRQIRILDPACGSGHFLLYCFDLLEAIYTEAYDDPELGPALHDEFPTMERFQYEIPGLILAHNLHGIDIDQRAVQIARLALWLRAQRRYGELKLKVRDRPHIDQIHIVCAEPMPGEYDLLGEFTRNLQPAALGNMLFDIWQEMKLTGEAGSLLKIETAIRGTIDKTRKSLEALPPSVQLQLFGPERPVQIGMDLPLQRADLLDTAFWEDAETRVIDALRDFARQASAELRTLRRLFTDDALQGMAFIDLLRQPFDVVLMNPPFGASSSGGKQYIETHYPRTKNDLYAAFVERGLELLRPGGYLGAITSRTGFFLSSFQKWREEILLKEANFITMADLGHGVLDTAMVETAAYVMQRKEADNE